ncbi:hypothetical protein [Tamilnaduibacter salinus]|uniref:hypothetical protein n=1 Tax=Tamilnaduibacter salinus TaxID=1484056 RepID=UPI00147602F6|nr:hypothetical protein [Tamilnaduibacter salinus]
MSQLILGCFFFDVANGASGRVLASACLYLLGGWDGLGGDLQFVGALFGLIVGSKISWYGGWVFSVK